MVSLRESYGWRISAFSRCLQIRLFETYRTIPYDFDGLASFSPPVSSMASGATPPVSTPGARALGTFCTLDLHRRIVWSWRFVEPANMAKIGQKGKIAN